MNKAILGVFKAREDSKELLIEGWANKAVVDRGGDLIPKEAWDLSNYEKNPIILFSHDKTAPIGRAVITEAKDEGLYVKAKISQSEAPDIAKVRDLIKEGILNAFSVGFDMKSSEKNSDGYNEIKSAELFEISVVAIPMNQDSVFSLSKSYDYDELKSLCTKADSDDSAAKDDKADEGDKAEAQSQDDKKPVPDETDAEGEKALAPKDELKIEVQALCLLKSEYPDLEAAKQLASSFGWSVELVEDDESEWCFVQIPSDQFVSLSDVQLGGGAYVVMGILKPETENTEDEETQEASKDITVPMPTEAPVVSEPENISQAKQTNVLLGVVVTELQKLRDAMLALAKAMPAQLAPQPVAVQEPKTIDNEALAPDTEIVREYLSSIQKTLDRIGA